MSDLEQQHRVLLWTLMEMGGEAWQDELIGATAMDRGQAIRAIHQLETSGHLGSTGHDGGRVWLTSDLSDVPKPPVNLRGLAKFKSTKLAAEKGNGLNVVARDLLRHMMQMLYGKPDLPSPLVPDWPRLKPFEIEIIERRARELVAENPLEGPQ